MSNPMNYDWFASTEQPDGTINVYAGQGDQSYQDFLNRSGPDAGSHGHFKIGPDGQDLFGRSGPRGSAPDYRG
jgi:hypothetical protein